MSDNVEKDLGWAVEESARLVGATCPPDGVRPILTAYRDALPESGIVFSVSTGERHAGELDFTITVPLAVGDPYEIALAHGLVEPTDHPVGALLADLRGRWPIHEHLIDCGVVAGFNKVYANFPHHQQPVAALAGIPSMPASLAENRPWFARYGLDSVAMLGIDYPQQTLNVYFAVPEGGLAPETIRTMIRELGFPEPTAPVLEFARRAFRVYVTLDWDTSAIRRICFAPPPIRGAFTTDPPPIPGPIEAHIEKFIRTAPRTYQGERITIAAAKWSAGGEYLNLGSYYQLSPLMRRLWQEMYQEQV
jgi:hypothetical protein